MNESVSDGIVIQRRSLREGLEHSSFLVGSVNIGHENNNLMRTDLTKGSVDVCTRQRDR